MQLAMISLLAGLLPASLPSADGEELRHAPVSLSQGVEAAPGAIAAIDRPTTLGKRAFDRRSKLYQAVSYDDERRRPPRPVSRPMREAYEQCVQQVARQEPARISRAGLEAAVGTRCSNQKAALRTAILQREGASPDSERLAAEELRHATDSAIASARRTPR